VLTTRRGRGRRQRQ